MTPNRFRVQVRAQLSLLGAGNSFIVFVLAVCGLWSGYLFQSTIRSVVPMPQPWRFLCEFLDSNGRKKIDWAWIFNLAFLWSWILMTRTRRTWSRQRHGSSLWSTISQTRQLGRARVTVLEASTVLKSNAFECYHMMENAANECPHISLFKFGHDLGKTVLARICHKYF